MLDDKSHVNELRDVYQQLSVIDCVENDYEDEYDDTYDDVDANIGNGGETEAEERLYTTTVAALIRILFYGIRRNLLLIIFVLLKC